MGLLFYPRGGSALVAGYLSRALIARGWHVTLACGSLGAEGALGNAATFFAGIDTVPAAYDDAVARWRRGEDPMDAPFPMHPSYEEREGVPDRSFPRVSPEQGERIVAAWARLIAGSADLRRARVFHLHHLTPIHEAAAAVMPDVPIVTHLHGTELKMLDAIARGEPGAGQGPHARWWAERMARGGAPRGCDDRHLPPPARRGRTAARARPRHRASAPGRRRRRALRRAAIGRSRSGARAGSSGSCAIRRAGTRRAGRPGSVRYTRGRGRRRVLRREHRRVAPRADVRRALPRVQARAVARARVRPRPRAHGRPGSARDLGRRAGRVGGRAPAHASPPARASSGVFFAGWRGHDDLPLGLACADCFVAPSTDEPFGLVYLEAMACGLPVIGTLSGGPPSFVNVVPGEPDGWLVPPDDEDALAEAIVQAVNDPAERSRRGENAARHVRDSYSWNGLAGRFTQLYDSLRAS